MKDRFEYRVCIVPDCNKVYRRRSKGMKKKKYRKDARPHRALACSNKCSKKWNRTVIKKRNAIKAQWRLKYNEERSNN